MHTFPCSRQPPRDAVSPSGSQQLKFKYFGHDMVVLHEHEIRKRKGAFRILMNRAIREPFMADLSTLVEEAPFTIISVVIRKYEFLQQHPHASNPYNTAMRFGLERIHKFLSSKGQGDHRTVVVFEARGKKEDNELELEFRRVCDGQNYRGKRFPMNIVIARKQINSSGLQLADLVARPIGRKRIKPEQTNRAYEILEAKMNRSPSGSIEGWGLKIYP